MSIRRALILLILLSALPLGAQTTLGDNPCSDASLSFAQGACSGCVLTDSTYTCDSCSHDGATSPSSQSIDMAGCATCSIAVVGTTSSEITPYCANLKVEFTMTTPLENPDQATIADTTESNIKTLVPLTYKFEIGGTSYSSDRVTAQQGEEITYYLGEAFIAAGYEFSGIKLLWQPPGSTAPTVSVSSDGQSITLTDEGTQAGGYVFLFELTNSSESGTTFRSQDPTLYNPPDTSTGGGG